jgi:hypothetical protein
MTKTGNRADARRTLRKKLLNSLRISTLGACLASAYPASAAVDAAHIQALENQVNILQDQLAQMVSGMAHHSGSAEGLPVHGFMDVGFATHTGSTTNNRGFNVGALSFYLTPKFGDRVTALVEPNFEVTSTGGINVDMERLQLGYALNDRLTGWAGRFHTPYGYWNTAFHHGSQMQTSILRPRFIDFEDKGGILPAHTVGLWATGKTRTAGGKVTYDLYVGNRPSIDAGVLNMNQAGNSNHQALVGANVGYEFSGTLSGLRLSLHTLRGNVNEVATPNETELNAFGGAAIYQARDWEVLSEYYDFGNRDKSGNTGTHNSWAGYLQVGKTFDSLTPYIRVEHAVLDQKDNYFSAQTDNGQSYARQSLGVRYEVNPNTALKLELLNSNFMADPARSASSSRSAYVQYAVGF